MTHFHKKCEKTLKIGIVDLVGDLCFRVRS